MGTSGEIILLVCPNPGDDEDDLARMAGWLRSELLDLDVQDVGSVALGDMPLGAKGASAVPAWLLVHLGPEALRAVLAKVGDWVARNDRVVEVSYGEDTLKVTRATREQQERIVDDWLARHPAVP